MTELNEVRERGNFCMIESALLKILRDYDLYLKRDF